MLQKLTEKDDMESYLDMFEHFEVAAQQGWPKETCAIQLAGLLSGNTLECYSSLTPTCAKYYDVAKAVILKRYDVLLNAETCRQRSHTETTKATESHVNFGERLDDHLGRWEKAADADGVDLQQFVLLEQFLQALPREMAIRVQEEKPKSVKEAAEMANNYELAQKAERVVECSNQSLQSLWYPHPANHLDPRVIPIIQVCYTTRMHLLPSKWSLCIVAKLPKVLKSKGERIGQLF